MEAFSEILSQYPQILCGGVGATACAAGAVIYIISTRKKPTHVNVNCWFCNQDTEVPYGNRNCWDCPYCDQYNGFQENGDYNKPIPAQYLEHLNHGVSPGFSLHESPRRQQWVNCQMLLCKKCNSNQSLKIKQLSSFLPRDDDKYDEEIEVYKHHLEQTYKLCRPCQTTVEYYIKHQNRQLRALLFNPQLRRSRDADKAFVKNSYSYSTPVRVILFRVLAFLASAFLVSVGVYGAGDAPAPSSPLQSPVDGAGGSNGTAPPRGDGSGGGGGPVWGDLLGLIPDELLEQADLVLLWGGSHQMAVVSLGLLACVTGILLAGPVRLRRIDAVASILWLLLLALYLLESYLKTDVDGWLDSLKFGTSSLCCLVGFAAAVATRRSTGQRRARGRRYLSGSSLGSFYSGQTAPPLSPSVSESSSFVPTPPPNLSHLLSRRLTHRARKPSPCSLPGRLNRALSLGTIPSLARTDSGYLFSGSRPSSQCKDSPPSDYFSLKSASRPSSPGPSPAPSVAGSVTSTSSSARQRRPLISPARLKLGGRKLQLFSPHPDPPPTLAPPPCPSEYTSFHHSGGFHPESSSPFPSPSHDLSSVLEDGSVFEDAQEKKRGSTSTSSACLVDTTTGAGVDSPKWKGVPGCSLWPGLLCVSLTANLVFSGLYMYSTWS